jgi:insertion element IS1 protein InsB
MFQRCGCVIFGITHDDTDDWGVYERHIEAEQPTIGQDKPQKIESQYIRLRT